MYQQWAIVVLFTGAGMMYAQPNDGYVAVGATLGAVRGFSYKNPSVGVFGAGRVWVGRFDFDGMASAERQQKDFARQGASAHLALRAACKLSPALAIMGVTIVSNHRNEQYNKTSTNLGVGLRMYHSTAKTVLEPYGYYLFPDLTSPNRVRGVYVGLEMRRRILGRTGLFVGVEGGPLWADQPFTVPVRTGMRGSAVILRIGLFFAGKASR